MNEQQVAEVAKAAFNSSFEDVKVVRVNVRRGFDYDEEDPTVDVNIIYDGKVEQLDGRGLVQVRSDVVSKVWREAEDSPGFPLVRFIAKSDIGRRDPATV